MGFSRSFFIGGDISGIRVSVLVGWVCFVFFFETVFVILFDTG